MFNIGQYLSFSLEVIKREINKDEKTPFLRRKRLKVSHYTLSHCVIFYANLSYVTKKQKVHRIKSIAVGGGG